MNVKRIVAKTSREAMRQLRDVLGANAVILSNRAVDGGVEVLAMAPEDIASIAPAAVDRPTPTPRQEAPQAEPEPAPRFNRNLIERISTAHQVAAPAQVTAPDQTLAATHDSAQLAQSVISEIKSMQMSLENQLSELAWRDLPGRDPAAAGVTIAIFTLRVLG